MKNRQKVQSLMALGGLLLGMQAAYSQQTAVIITNPSSVERKDEIIVLKRADAEKKLGAVKYISATCNNQNVVVQHDDLNGDGRWDEAVFLVSLKPHEKAAVKISAASDNDLSSAVQKAHVRLRKKNPDESFGPYIKKETMPLRNPATDFSKQKLPMYLTEGPAWENDKIAFRLYFDVRNGKDIYAKRTPRMMMDTVGVNTKVSYHNLADWGMDVLHAGKSLGSGALALLVPKEGKDTLIRLGGEDITHTVYEQMADGPVRAMFKITYDWQVMGKPVQIIEQTSIWGGQYFYEDKVTVAGAPLNTKLVAGIASFYENVFQSFYKGNCGVLLSHGKQSENKDYLGMAVVIPANNTSHFGSTPNQGSEILDTYLAAQYIKKDQPCRFRFYGAWELTDSRFASINYFKNMVVDETVKMDKPVMVKWQ